MTQTEQNWYDKNWLVYLLCFLFFPVGIYALWKNQSISKGLKIGITAFIGILVIISFGGKGNENTNQTKTEENKPSTTNIELTQEQKDSIANEEIKIQIKEREDNTISAKQLTATYQANEVNADNNFKGKTFYVTGTVTDIKKDIMDNIYVTLEGDEMFREVQCFFEDKEVAGQMQKGMVVTFKGKCDGLMMNVLMKDCVLAENLSDIKKKLK